MGVTNMPRQSNAAAKLGNLKRIFSELGEQPDKGFTIRLP